MSGENGASRLPNFLYVGTGKAGSTWLFRVLSDHPDAFLTPVKETNFFDINYERGADWYRKFFSGAANEAAVGEVGHRYMRDPRSAGRIKETLEEGVRVLVGLREPSDYALSDYMFVRRNGGTDLAVDEYLDRKFDWDALDYQVMLQPYVEQLGVEQIEICDFAVLQQDPQVYLDRITDFLGISRMVLDRNKLGAVNSAQAARFVPLARQVTRLSKWMKRRGGQRVIQVVKNSRLVQSVLYKPPPERPTLSDQSVQRLRASAAGGVSWIDSTFGTSIRSSWYGADE